METTVWPLILGQVEQAAQAASSPGYGLVTAVLSVVLTAVLSTFVLVITLFVKYIRSRDTRDLTRDAAHSEVVRQIVSEAREDRADIIDKFRDEMRLAREDIQRMRDAEVATANTLRGMLHDRKQSEQFYELLVTRLEKVIPLRQDNGT